MIEQDKTRYQLTRPTPVPTLSNQGVIFMAEAPQPRVEHAPNPEKLQYQEGLVGLQARLLLEGPALDPNNRSLPPFAESQLPQKTTYSPFIDASTKERIAYWQGKEEDDFVKQKQEWMKQTNATFASSKKFFESSKGTAWAVLFKKLSIDTQNFDAEKLYNNYFSDENPSGNIDKFITDVISSHTIDNKFNLSAFNENKTAIQWLANIFGDKSSQIIAQLTDAEVSVKYTKQQFIDAANKTTEQNTQSQTRINTLTSSEVDLLSFVHNPDEYLTQNPPTPVSPRQTPPPPTGPAPTQQTNEGVQSSHPTRSTTSEYYWKNSPSTKEGVRSFLGEDELVVVTNPQTIAELIKHKYPGVSLETLKEQVAHEQHQLHHDLERLGLPVSQLEAIAKNAITHYESFLQSTYGVSTPQIEHISFIPVSGKTVEAYNNHDAFAFVYPHYPAIFLNMDRIDEEAKRIGRPGLGSLQPDEFSQIAERLLNEINPHEYTHLIGDTSFWEYKKRSDDTDAHKFVGAKSGIRVTRPPAAGKEDIDIRNSISRGNDLSEALTTELTNKWAESIGGRLDINAYAQERKILDLLVQQLAQTKQVSEDEAFKLFAQGYFSPDAFRTLVKELSDPQEYTTDEGKPAVKYNRPHLLSIVYGLMDYDKKITPAGRESNYVLTKNFLTNGLTPDQKSLIIHDMDTLALSDPIKQYLKTALS